MSIPFFISRAERETLFAPIAKASRRIEAGTKPAGKLVFLESARGVAALVVVLYHLALGFLPRDTMMQHPPVYASMAGRLLHRLFEGTLAVGLNGPFAVRFFFVLSGFVLSRSYLKSRDIDVLRSAAIRRFPRLAVPVAGTVLLAWLMSLFAAPVGGQIAAMAGQQPYAWIVTITGVRLPFSAAAVQAFYGAIFNFNMDTSLDGCLWTMHVELFNSFVVFAMLPLIAGLPRRGSLYAGIAVLLTAAQQFYTVDFVMGMAIADFSLHAPARCKGVLEGARIALLAPALIVPVLASVLMQHLSTYAAYVQWLPTLCAATILLGLLSCVPLQRSLETRLLSHLGKISFGIYLIHMPIFSSFGIQLYLWMRRSQHSSHATATAISAIATLSISWVMAIAIHRWLEQPGMDLGRTLDRWLRGTAQPRDIRGAEMRPSMALAS